MHDEPDTLPLELLCCPRCAGILSGGSGLVCSGCDQAFPTVGGLPWLFEDPAAALGHWRSQLRALVSGLQVQSARYRAALDDERAGAATRSRLKLLSAACAEHARRLTALLAPLEVGASAAAPELYDAISAANLPAGQGLTGYYANLHRDWCWGERENEAAYRLVDEATGERECGRTLVLGAGAARLAYDFHARRRPAVLLAADLNPLMLLVARQVMHGGAVQLYEFPLAPRDIESHAVLRTLSAPGACGPGLHLVFADVSCGPFADGAFDTIVTPWLIDVLDEDFASFARRVNRWLAPGGRWVNTGSLTFQHADPARCYTLEELRPLLERAGFDPPEIREDRLPYLQSPLSRQARTETVVTWSVDKAREIDAPPRWSPLPDWLRRDDLPVPLPPELASRVLSMRVLSFVASLIDGRRTLGEIAAVLVRERLMAQDEAAAAVRGFLLRLHLESTQQPRSP